mmetsp:Transcript_6097/g.18423  ORF Transcript_6097/g.18423 Transcript_6097/m.18423 type:complete len:272 (-) Transcript_6097:420-1235(-)
MLYFIGVGLGDERDITLKGLDAVKGSARVYLESYTSILPGVDKSALEALYGKTIEVADREFVEERAGEIVDGADGEDVSFLVVGDPFGATTHTDLWVRARKQGVPVRVIHNASIMNAIGACGLQLYRYGEAISIAFFTESWRPDSWYEKIASNLKAGLHTLCLLDIKVKEPSLEALARGKKVYEPPRFMTIQQGIDQLLEVEGRKKAGLFSEDTLCVGVARLGQEKQVIAAGPMKQLREYDFGPPLHSLVIPGTMHFLEEEILSEFRVDKG